jgi:DNA-binding transcriptional MerR regulator
MQNKLRVRDVAERFEISKRTIKYYEEIGILKSQREEGSNYRIYDSEALERLEKILILRRLSFSISDICQILDSNNSYARVIFEKKLQSIRDEMNALKSLQAIVEAFLDISNSKGIDNVNIYQLLSEQVYIHKKVERMINMHNYQGDWLKLEIGNSIVPHANQLIENIKALRNELKPQFEEDIPLIRLVDNNELDDMAYRILFKGSPVFSGKLEDGSLPQEISALISKLKEIIIKNID